MKILKIQKLTICLMAVVLFYWVFCSLVLADTDDDRIRALEKRIEELEKQKNEQRMDSAVKDKFAGKSVSTMHSFWDNDFYISTQDENFWMKIRGNLHVDSKFYGGNSHNPTHFDIRRARFDFQGMWYKYISFRCQAEFADSPYARNFWADYKFRDALHLRVGQMKPPFSTAWWTTDNNLNFLERMSSTPIYPYFDRGFWLWGDVFKNTLAWNLSAFTGAGMDFDYKKGDIDDHKDYVGKFFFAPFKNNNDGILKGLYFCVAGSYGHESIISKRFEGKGYGAAVRDDQFWTWEADDARIDSRTRYAGEIHFISGPFSLSSEYLATQWKDIEVGTVKEDGDIWTWGAWVSYFLTGESKQVSNFGWKQPKPATYFDPVNMQGCGAWEILARYTHTETDEDLFDAGILKGSTKVDEVTLGLCWTWNPMVRWQLNYSHLKGNRDGIRTGSSDSEDGTGYVENEDAVGLRMIFKF